ncbi:transposase [Sinirhodobacter populi]|uniref:Transposase n=1 Tax=Paenirhodobacter populi TaxID=2306993 RepID=A0A443K6Q8_9RHOB|nr:transposase [Sinirhodobacter populi]
MFSGRGLCPCCRARLPIRGQTGSDNRLFINGCLWVLRSSAHRGDLPKRYIKRKTVHRLLNRWCYVGIWEQSRKTSMSE